MTSRPPITAWAHRTLLLALLVITATPTITTAAPPILNHQGRIAVDNANYHGDGYFKFALVDSGATQTFWSNDGTSGGEPASAVTVAVAQGHYAVLLGDTAIANMTSAIPNSVFADHDDVYLRVWFSSDNLTFTQLAPDRRITPAAYAFSASIAESLAPGYETGSGSDLTLQGVVGNALTLDADFAQPFPTAPSIDLDPAWNITSTGSSGFTANAAFVAQTIDPGGQAGSHASLTVINARPAVAYRDDSAGGSLFFIRSTDASGSSWPASAIVQVDGAIDDVGQFASLAQIDGRPAIAYYDLTHGNLRFSRAEDSSGTAWPEVPITVDGASSNTGRHCSLAVIGGVPAISYQSPNSGEIHYAWAADAAGTTWPAGNRVAIEGSLAAYRQQTSLAEVNGKPAIAFYNSTDGNLRFTRLTGNDASNPADWTTSDVDSGGDVGRNPALAISGGNPSISYEDSDNGTIKYARASNPDGTTWANAVTVDSGTEPSLAKLGGQMAVSYYDPASGDLKLAIAADATGSSWPAGNRVTADGGTPNVGTHSSLALVAGLPTIAYHDSSSSALKFASLPDASWSATTGAAEPILASGVKDGGVSAAMLDAEIGVWKKSGDDLFYDDGRVGVGRLATGNNFEVEGSASKSTAGNWAANSDRRIKDDIRPIQGALERILAVRLVDFKYRDDYLAAHPSIADRRYPNVIAQEFCEVFPDWVRPSGEQLPDGSDEILQVDTYPLTIYNSAALQELVKKNADLEARIAQLEELVERLAAARPEPTRIAPHPDSR